MTQHFPQGCWGLTQELQPQLRPVQHQTLFCPCFCLLARHGAQAPAGVPAASPCPQNPTRARCGCADREAWGASQLAFQVAPAPWAGGEHGAL